jgi:hypothetical protein
MTEWTMDMEIPDPDLVDTLRAGQLLDRAAEDTFYRELVSDPLTGDDEDRGDQLDWFE